MEELLSRLLETQFCAGRSGLILVRVWMNTKDYNDLRRYLVDKFPCYRYGDDKDPNQMFVCGFVVECDDSIDEGYVPLYE